MAATVNCTHCGPSLKRAPTAGHEARVGGTRYILAIPGLADCRRGPSSSNVGQHRSRPLLDRGQCTPRSQPNPQMPSLAGYSGTPLAKKLGIIANACVVTRWAPDDYAELVDPVPPGVTFEEKVSTATDVVHVFTVEKSRLAEELTALRDEIRSDAAVWVSWPKKASKVATNITEDTIRELALPLGFVDVKVCAVSVVWSGLKLVIRKELR